MKLTVVGCSGSIPSVDSPCSSYLVEADGFRLLLDMGNGALGELQRHIGLNELDAVVLSHLHADHCIDMCAYFVVRYYNADPLTTGPLPVYGPEGTEERLTAGHGDTPTRSAMAEVFDFHTLKPGSFRIGPFTLHAEQVRHPVEAYGFRVEHEGRSLTYSGDTGPAAALDQLAADSDLFLCEAAFTDGKEEIPDLHLNGRDAGESAQRAGARRLVLTHIPPSDRPPAQPDGRPRGLRGPRRTRAHRRRLRNLSPAPHAPRPLPPHGKGPSSCHSRAPSPAPPPGPGRDPPRAPARTAPHARVSSSNSSSGSRPGVFRSNRVIAKRNTT
ncbi:Ribonuclease BN, tRNA processing enzyme [Streptomyces sp. DfronAA-171]|nr:Ribonuclease BN, tRNA processing enzyme [Streptomyces sp. DfronAA-171]